MVIVYQASDLKASASAKLKMSLRMRIPTIRVSDLRTDTNQPEQTQKKARSLKV